MGRLRGPAASHELRLGDARAGNDPLRKDNAVSEVLERSFARMGARVKCGTQVRTRSWQREDVSFVSLDVLRDGRGEFFDIRVNPDSNAEVSVLDVQPKDRHLLLMVRRPEGGTFEKHKFLCGHDERHWFVAAIPEAAAVSTVRQAKVALKPAEVRAEESRRGLRDKVAQRRRNPAAIRQGEWFFVPARNLAVPKNLILRNEPLVRNGKPHLAEECYRSGGETVYVCRDYPSGVIEADYRRIIEEQPSARKWNWRVMRRNADVYVRGTISHPDHKTIRLAGWCKVLTNTEHQAAAMRHVVFLD